MELRGDLFSILREWCCIKDSILLLSIFVRLCLSVVLEGLLFQVLVLFFFLFFMRDWIKIWNKYSFVIFMLHFCFVLCDLNLNLSRVSV